MNLINEAVTHKVFGEGSIVEHEESIITIEFNKDIKKFVYPDAFGKFITLNDRSIAQAFKDVFLKREMEEEALEKKREEENERLVLEQRRRDKLKNHKIHESSQVVFWLDEEEQESVFVDWEASTGVLQSGKNKGQPNRAARLGPNSVGLLTARASDQPEVERQILGLYMVDEMFSGNQSNDGMVPSHTAYRIELTDQEAEKMLFWNYYINKNYPDRTAWNSGKYRYFDNVMTAQILNDIIALKTDEDEINEANSFLNYFCERNVLDINDIPEAAGALKQSSFVDSAG